MWLIVTRLKKFRWIRRVRSVLRATTRSSPWTACFSFRLPIRSGRANWGVKVLRYEIKDLTPPAVILQAMQQQITAEREKRAVVAASEGRKLEQINLATGAREAAIAQSEGDKQAEINKAEGQAAATLAIATATAEALRRIAEATQAPGGATAVSLQVAEKYVAAFGELARTNNTLIVPGNMGDLSTMITSAMKIVDGAKNGAAASSGLPSKP